MTFDLSPSDSAGSRSLERFYWPFRISFLRRCPNQWRGEQQNPEIENNADNGYGDTLSTHNRCKGEQETDETQRQSDESRVEDWNRQLPIGDANW